MSISRKKGIFPALTLAAMLALGSVSALAPAPVAAQNIFASPSAARSAGVNTTQSGYAYAASQPMAAGDPAPTGDASPYTAIFSQIQTATTGLLSGPGALAFGILILGLGFGVAWRLVTKGVKSVAK